MPLDAFVDPDAAGAAGEWPQRTAGPPAAGELHPEGRLEPGHEPGGEQVSPACAPSCTWSPGPASWPPTPALGAMSAPPGRQSRPGLGQVLPPRVGGQFCLSTSPGLVLSLSWTVSPAVKRCLLCQGRRWQADDLLILGKVGLDLPPQLSCPPGLPAWFRDPASVRHRGVSSVKCHRLPLCVASRPGCGLTGQ